MFKLKFIARGSSTSRPYIIRETFQETPDRSVDEYVHKYLTDTLFRHGFREVRVVIQRFDEFKVLHTHETLSIKLERGRR
jgi:hypothetical protein